MAGNLTDDNYNELCRLCAAKTNILLRLNIFEDEGNVREIDKKIATLLTVQVHEADRLPKMICSECIYKLDLLFTFREKSIETECFLIELMNKIPLHNHHHHTIIEKPKSPPVHIMDDHQMNTDGLLGHPNISLVHDMAIRENLVSEEMILGVHENMHNHELENIEIAPNELNTHENLHNHHHLDLHHESEMAQLVQQNMQISDTQLSVENIHMLPQHNLVSNYEAMQEKHLDVQDLDDRPMLTLKDQRGLMEVHIELIKTESQGETDTIKYSDPSDTDDSSDAEFESTLNSSAGENMKNEIINSNLYDEQEHNNANIGASEPTDEKTQFSCNLCGKMTTDREEHLTHYGEHLNECLICNEAFANLEALNVHKKEIHSRRPQNRKSHKSIKSRARLKEDSIVNIEDNFFKEESSDDEKSNEFMPAEDEDEEDEETVDKNGKRRKWQPKVCKECGKHYKTNYKLAEHMRKHTGEQPFKCSMCVKAFRSKIGLAQHEAKHTGQFDFACPTCGKGFQCRSYLIVHQRVHSDLKPYPCTTCGRNFKTKQSLLDHMNRHLGVKPFMCEICGRSFITKGLCKSHQKVHSGTDNRQFPCSVCNKLFVSKSYLATHVRIHTGEKPFMCEVCGKGFLTRVDLRIHSTMHTGEKSFVCEMCGKAFARRDALRCHRRSHTGERPYSCDICGQTFTQFSPMAIHKRLHTGERPYSCEVCKKAFVSRSTMMSHRKKHRP